MESSNSQLKQPKVVDVSSNVEDILSSIKNRSLSVVIEDASDLIDAVQQKKLNKPDKTHSLVSHLIEDQKHLKSLPARLPIKWPDMSEDDAWTKFETSVFPKLLPVTSLAARVDILESAVFDTAVEFFVHPPTKNQSHKIFNSKRKQIMDLVLNCSRCSTMPDHLSKLKVCNLYF